MALVLRAISSNGTVTDFALGDMSNIEVAEGSTYSLIDSETQQPVEGAELKRRGDDLEIEVEGEAVASLDGFYSDGANSAFSDGSSAVATSVEGGEAAWQVGGVEAGLVALGVGGAALASGGGGSAAAVQSILIAAAAGPFVTTMGVEIYGEDGTLLAELEHDFSTGPVPVDIDGDYSGALLVKVIDINGDAGDYLDEATGEILSLGAQSVRAMASTENTEVSVTPLTELATVLAGVTDDNTITAEQVATNDQVAELFDLTDILGPVITIAEDEFDITDGLSAAEDYGNILAILSGADANTAEGDTTPETPTSLTETIQQIAAAINEASEGSDALVLGEEAATLIIEGGAALDEGLAEQAAAAEEAGEEFDIVIDVEEALPDAVLEAAVDTTSPTTTISGISISVDTGSDTTDFLTNTAAQTVTATLSAALVAGEVVMASTDGGVTFVDVTSSVTGTAVSFAATLTSGSIQLRVDDTAGNQGALATQSYTLDVTAPTMTALVGADGTVVVTLSEAATGLTAQDFVLSVNGAEVEISAIAVDGLVVTLTPTAPIYNSDAVNLASTITDDAGNGTATLTSITNGSISVSEVLEAAFSSLTGSGDLTILQTGGDSTESGAVGNDLLSVKVYEGTADLGIYNLDIDQAGNAGNDVISATLEGQFIGNSSGASSYSSSSSSSSSVASVNVINQSGGAGDDALSVNLIAAATAVAVYTDTSTDTESGIVTSTSTSTSSGVFAEIVSNNVNMSGGAGVDSLALAVAAAGAGSELAKDGVEAIVAWNDFTLDGGNGADSSISVQIGAFAENNATGTDTYTSVGYGYLPTVSGGSAWGTGTFTRNYGAEASAAVSYNTLDILGGTGIDNVEAGLYATAQAESRADADISYNEIYVTAENIHLEMVADASASDDANAVVGYNDLFINASYNNITLTTTESVVSTESGGFTGTGSYITTTVQAADAEGAVDVDLYLTANANGVSSGSADAQVGYNEALIYGGDSADNFDIALNANALVSSFTNTKGISASADVSENDITIHAGAGADTIGIELRALADNDAIATGTAVPSYSSESIEFGPGGPSYIDIFGPTADASNSDNQLDIYGGAGIDTLMVDLYATAQALLEADAEVSGNDLYITAENIDLELVANASASSASATVSENDITLNAQRTQVTVQGTYGATYGSATYSSRYSTTVAADIEGAADVDLSMSANADAVTSAYAYMGDNDVEAYGGDSADDFDLIMNANAFVATSTGNTNNGRATAEALYNDVTLYAGDGADVMSIQLGALAGNNATGAGSNTFTNTYVSASSTTTTTRTTYYNQQAFAAVRNNDLELYGSTGIDTIDVDYIAQALGSQAYAAVGSNWSGNDISATAENVDINLMALAGMTAEQTSPATAANAFALVQNNEITINSDSSVNVEGMADIDVNLAAYALATGSGEVARTGSSYSSESFLSYRDISNAVSANALVANNEFDIYGGDSADDIDLTMNANAFVATNTGNTDGGGAAAVVSYNDVDLYAGDGADMISVQLGAAVDNNATGAGTSTAVYTFSRWTGSGSVTVTDIRTIAYNQQAFAAVKGNDLELYGETGIDTIDVDFTAQALGSQAYAQVGSYSSWNGGNTISATAENVDINLMALAGMTTEQTSPATAANVAAFVQNNDILINAATSYSSSSSSASSVSVAGMADIDVNLAAYALATGSGEVARTGSSYSSEPFLSYSDISNAASANALVGNNDLGIYGGDSADEFDLTMNANAFVATNTGNTDGGAAGAIVSNNDVDLYAGDGADLINVQLGAFVDNNATGSGTNTAVITYTSEGTVTSSETRTLAYNQQAIASLKDNDLALYGGTGVDTIDVDFTAEALGSQAYAQVGSRSSWSGNAINVTAENADINLMALAGMTAEQTSPATAVQALAGVQNVDIMINAATSYSSSSSSASSVDVEGMADIDVNLAAYAMAAGSDNANVGSYSSAGSAIAVVSRNDLDIYGGDSADEFDLTMNANAFVTTNTENTFNGAATAVVSYNEGSIHAGDGADMMSVQLGALVDNNATGSGANTYMTGPTATPFTGVSYYDQQANAAVQNNDLSLYGETGVDTIDLDFTAVALGSQATAYVGASSSWNGNDIAATAENVDINLMALAGVTAEQTSLASAPVTAANAEAYVLNNEIVINASGTYFSPAATANIEGAVDINVNLAAYALASDYAYAVVRDNDIDIYGGDGDDIISVGLVASALGASALSYASNNDIFIDGGAGADAINLDLIGSYNALDFYYEDAGDFGDTIVGLDAIWAGNNDVDFDFGSAFAGANVFGSAAAVAGSAAAFYYDAFSSTSATSSFALYYDTNGTGTGGVSTVAVFTADIGSTGFSVSISGVV